MILVGRPTLRQFTNKHADAREWINAWIAEIEKAKWKDPQDVKRQYVHASILADNIVIFNVKGNSYRLEVQLAYNTGIITVKWIGTHAEYTKRYK